MKKLIQINYLGFLLFLSLGISSAFTQQYFPFVAKFTQTPPYPVYLADFSNPNQTSLSIQMQIKDNQIASRPIRLKLYVEGQGFRYESTDLVQGEPAMVLSLGQIYNLPNSQVANYFKQYNLKISGVQYQLPLTEGVFRFGIQVIDVATSRPLSGVQWGNQVWITVNEPPIWIMPANNVAQIPQKPQNLNFQWAPRHKNVGDVEYEFTITELIVNDGFKGNIQNLFLSQPPYYKVRTRATTLNYNAALPPLLPGRTYAYRVQAIAKRGFEDVGVFRNNGFSEIQAFKYAEPIPELRPPTQLKVAWTNGEKAAKFEWKGEPEHKKFEVAYRPKASAGDWKLATLEAQVGKSNYSYDVPNLIPSTNYELKVFGINNIAKKVESTTIPLNSEDILAFIKTPGISKDVKDFAVKVDQDSTSQKAKKAEPTCDKPAVAIDKESSYEVKAGDALLAGNFKYISSNEKKGVIQWSIPFAESLKLPVKKVNIWTEEVKAAFNSDKQLKDGSLKVVYNADKLKELKRISDAMPFDSLMGKGVVKQLDSVSKAINTYIGKGQKMVKNMASKDSLQANYKIYKGNLDTLNQLYAAKDSLLTLGIKNMKKNVDDKKDDKKKDDKKDDKKKDDKKDDKKKDDPATVVAKTEEKKEDKAKEDKKKEEEFTKKVKEQIKDNIIAMELRQKDLLAEKENVNKFKKFIEENDKAIEKSKTDVKAFDPEKAYKAGYLTEYNSKLKDTFISDPATNTFKIFKAMFYQFYNGKIAGARLSFK